MSIGSFYAVNRSRSHEEPRRGAREMPTADRYQPQGYDAHPVVHTDRLQHHTTGMYRGRESHAGAPYRQESGWDERDDDEEEPQEHKHKSYAMTRDKAIAWMESLRNEDPAHPTGPRWTMEEVKPYATKHGIEEGSEEYLEFWAAMNMLYSDYYAVFREYNLTTPDAFAKMAKAFLHDKDAMDHKLGRYYCGVVQK